MPYSPARIANYFIEKSDYTATPMKVMGLVYIAHGWCLALTDCPLIDGPIEAWRYGPTIRSLYDSLKRYGNQPITKLIPYEYEEDGLTSEYTKFLDRIWEEFGDYTGEQLSNLTHQKDTPWLIIWHGCGMHRGYRNYKINNKLIKEYYTNILQEED